MIIQINIINFFASQSFLKTLCTRTIKKKEVEIIQLTLPDVKKFLGRCKNWPRHLWSSMELAKKVLSHIFLGPEKKIFLQNINELKKKKKVNLKFYYKIKILSDAIILLKLCKVNSKL